MGKFTQLELWRFAPSGREQFLKVDVKSVQKYQRKAGAVWSGHKEALEELVTEAKKSKEVLLYCEADAEISRVTEIVKQFND